MKHSTPESIKFRKLQRRLGLPRYAVAGLLEMLWIATIKNAPRGDIGRFDNESIAIECDWEGDADEFVAALVDAKWLDRCAENRLVVHDWADHAPYFVRGIASRQGGFLTPKTEQLSTPTIVTQLSTPPVATIVADYTGQQPNLTQYNVTQPSITKPNVTQPSMTPSLASQAMPVSVDDFFSRWNRFAEKTPKIKSCRKLTTERRRKITTRLKEPSWFEDFREAVASLPLGGDGWQPTLDWLIENGHNAYRLLEGDFDWRSKDDPAAIRLAQTRRTNALREREEFEKRKKEELKSESSKTHRIIESISQVKNGSDDETHGESLLFGKENDLSASGALPCSGP